MTPNDMERLISVLEESFADAEQDTPAFISIESKLSKSVGVRANRAGLIRLSLLIFRLAVSGRRGNHIHIDEFSEADQAEVELTISFDAAPWEQ